MAVLTSEAVVLRTWPVHEADLIVSFFTRDYGKMRGVAKSALKSRRRFGGALEPMTEARAWFAERPRQELVRLDQLEIVRSPLAMPVDATRLGVLSFYAEVLDEALPEHDPQDTIFRLTVSVLEQTTVQQPWMPLTYFTLWMTRLMGLLPDRGIARRAARRCGPGEIFFNGYADGLFCAVHRHPHDEELAADSWQRGLKMLRAPVASFAGETWSRGRGQDLRRFTSQVLERHLERKIRSAEMLNRVQGSGISESDFTD